VNLFLPDSKRLCTQERKEENEFRKVDGKTATSTTKKRPDLSKDLKIYSSDLNIF
jgi:hypothetical protein